MQLDSKIWGPHYWFFLHTIAVCYPHRPNAVTKKKYYEFIQNLHLFIPVETMATYFNKLINEYPVAPYLDTKDSFIRWMHFIHNKINQQLEKPKISLNDFYVQYYDAYKPKEIKLKEHYKMRGRLIYLALIVLFICVIYYLYNK
jgi:hypothetical protein